MHTLCPLVVSCRFHLSTLCLCVMMLILPVASASAASESNLYLAHIRTNQMSHWTGNINVLGSYSSFTSPEWDAVSQQISTGFTSDIGQDTWVFRLAIDYHNTSETNTANGISYQSDVTELDIGTRIYIEDPHLHWAAYLGAGIALIDDQLTAPAIGFDESGSELGYWLNAGLVYRIHNTWNIGIDARYSNLFAETIDNPRLNPRRHMLGVLVGYHW